MLLIKLRQIFTAFAVSLSGQKIKFLIIIIPVFFFYESVLTSSDSSAPRSKMSMSTISLSSSLFSSVIEELEN